MATETRVDPSLFSDVERGNLPRIVGAIEQSPVLMIGDERLPLPEPLTQFLASVLRDLSHGKSVIVIPEDEVFTTQGAAGFLGMSRQYFVAEILEKGQVPFHRVGTHRRVSYKDLLAFKKKRDAARRKTLDNVFDEVNSIGLYDASAGYTGEADAGR